jgi:hypothetical protein
VYTTVLAFRNRDMTIGKRRLVNDSSDSRAKRPNQQVEPLKQSIPTFSH